MYIQADRDRTTSGRDVMSMNVDQLDLPVRPHNCLRNAGIEKVGDLVVKTADELLKIRSMGRGSVQEIKRALERVGLHLGMSGEVGSGEHSRTGDVMSMDVKELDLTTRALTCLQGAGVVSVGDLVRKTAVELVSIHGMGAAGVCVIEEALEAVGLGLRSDEDFDSFVRGIQILGRQDIDSAEKITNMTTDELLALPDFDRGALEAVAKGLSRWGLSLGSRVERGTSSSEGQGREVVTDRDGWEETAKDELLRVVKELLEERRGVSHRCFIAYRGIDGERRKTLQEIGEEGSRYGFNNAVTRERVRQVVQKSEDRLRRKAGSRFPSWQLATEDAKKDLPVSVSSFASKFGYDSAEDPEAVFVMLKRCADVFGLEYEFDTIERIVIEAADDAMRALVAGLPEMARPYAELKNVVESAGCEEGKLKEIIHGIPELEFLEEECLYFWKRPGLPPKNYGFTGNAILTCLCKVFSVATHATVSDLVQSVPRERNLRREGHVMKIPGPVIEGVARCSGLFDVDGGRIVKKEGLHWCSIGQRDLALLKICAEHGRVVPSTVVYAGLVGAGLTRENAAVTVAYSPFLVHTRSGLGYREGIYKFVVRPDEIEVEDLERRVRGDVDVDGDGESEAGSTDDHVSVSHVLRIPVSSRLKLSGRYFSPEPLGLDGQWDVRDSNGLEIGRITISGRTVNGLDLVVNALELKNGDILGLRQTASGVLVVGS